MCAALYGPVWHFNFNWFSCNFDVISGRILSKEMVGGPGVSYAFSSARFVYNSSSIASYFYSYSVCYFFFTI